MSRCCAVAALIALSMLPATATTQDVPRDTVGLRPGWAAEGGIGGYPSATLMHIGRSGFAWLGAVSGQLATERREWNGSRETSRVTSGGLRFGARSYRGRGALRPFVGLGALASVSEFNDGDARGVGGYMELGASYLLTSHLSVGVATELQAGYSRLKQRTDFSTFTAKRWSYTIPSPSLRVAVYF